MTSNKIRNDNYYVVHGWMRNELNLSGIDLDIYAIIYGFSQDGETEFTGSIQYLCDFTGASKPTVINSIKRLVDAEYIIKRTETINNVAFNRYKIYLGGSKDSLLPVKNLYGGSKDSLHNNNIYNNTTKSSIIKNSPSSPNTVSRKGLISKPDKKSIEKQAKVEKYVFECHHISEEFEFPDKVSDKLIDFFRMLGQAGAFLPDVTIRAQLEDIVNLNEKQQLQVISDTIKSGWKSLKYAVEKVKESGTASFDTAKPGSFQPKDPNNDRRKEQYEDDEVF